MPAYLGCFGPAAEECRSAENFRTGEGAAADRLDFGEGNHATCAPKSQMGRMALTASVQLELGRNTDLVSERYNPSGDIPIFIVGNQNVSAFH